MPSMTVDCLASFVNAIGVQLELYSELCEERTQQANDASERSIRRPCEA